MANQALFLALDIAFIRFLARDRFSRFRLLADMVYSTNLLTYLLYNENDLYSITVYVYDYQDNCDLQ